MNTKSSQIVLITFVLILQACSISPKITLKNIEPVQEKEPIAEVEVEVSVVEPAAEHRIGVRVVGGIGEFFDRQTNEKFIPRGNNYISLDPMTKKGNGPVITFSMFNPSYYDHEKISNALSQMHEQGYNIVRIFAESEGADGIGADDGLSSDYIENLADFLILAKENSIYAIITKQWLPISQRYGSILEKQCCSTYNFANLIHLSPAGIEAHQMFFVDLIQELIKHYAPLDAIFSFNISNEFYFDSDQPPLSWSSGIVRSASGKEYDMAKPEDKNSMMDEALVMMIDSVRDAIREVDPTALVSIGFFAPQEPNPHRIGDPRISRTIAAIWNSEADYIDLHAYPGDDLTLEQYLENYGMNNMQETPVILGEFGAFTVNFPSVDAAADALVEWQVESCKFGIDGWLLWTWDDTTIGEILPATMDKGQIAQALSPVMRPDACTYGGIVSRSLVGKASASNSLPSEPPENALDGLADTQWGAGLDAVQWIEIDLGKPESIREIRLLVAQWPSGESTHLIKVRSESSQFIVAHEFDQITKSDDWLIFNPEISMDDIRYIRVETIKSPSWVAWKEIQIFGY